MNLWKSLDLCLNAVFENASDAEIKWFRAWDRLLAPGYSAFFALLAAGGDHLVRKSFHFSGSGSPPVSSLTIPRESRKRRLFPGQRSEVSLQFLG